MPSNFCIAYLSPNGSTAKVAAAANDRLRSGGASVFLADLSDAGGRHALKTRMRGDGTDCLLIGSPVFRDVAVPPVMAFIEELPQSTNAWAVPFVTYGGACSGVALWQMAMALQDKGYGIAAAAKVVALHSMMWQADHPPGEGRPDDDDLQQVRQLADRLLASFSTGGVESLALDALDYQPEKRAAAFKAKIDQPWMIVPKQVDDNKCTQCGICADVCPVAAVRLDPGPQFGGTCIDCFNCIRLCPESAIAPAVPMTTIETMIWERVQEINEQPPTRIFYP
jgi:ferredoxin